MKIALATIKISDNIQANAAKICSYIQQAAQNSAELIVFPEDCFTGLANNDDPNHDIPLGRSQDCDEIKLICKTADANHIIVVLGFLELSGNTLYDSSIIISEQGKIEFLHRRNNSGWHGANADYQIYKQGDKIIKYTTKFGSIVILLCGELFDKKIVQEAADLKPDILIFSFLRDTDNFSQTWWDEEFAEYKKQFKKIGSTVLAVNGIFASNSTGSFGGSWIIDNKNNTIAEANLFEEMILYGNI